MNSSKFKLVKQWTTKAGLEAYIVLVRNSHHCGYVEVPDSIQHLDLEMEDIQVHGGVTFQGEAPLILDKHLVGFDCAHTGDALRNPDGTINDLFGGVWRDEEYCIQECESLAVQLISLMSITSAAKAKPDDTDSTVTPASHTLVLLPTDNYAFKDVELTGAEWLDIHREWGWQTTRVCAEGIWLCINEEGRYCFVFTDEAEQFSQPYPTVQEAMDARKRYMENL